MQRKIKLKPYECTILLVISDNFVKDAKKFEKSYKMDTEEYKDTGEGVTMWDHTRYATVINSKYLTHNTIAHEMFHLTCKISGDRDINDEESRAWICGYVTSEFYKLLDKWTSKKDTSPSLPLTITTPPENTINPKPL